MPAHGLSQGSPVVRCTRRMDIARGRLGGKQTPLHFFQRNTISYRTVPSRFAYNAYRFSVCFFFSKKETLFSRVPFIFPRYTLCAAVKRLSFRPGKTQRAPSRRDSYETELIPIVINLIINMYY
jgi:hypothetical protein